MQPPIYDFAGIGIGPFNLGLAALTAPIQKLKGIFFDSKPQFSWHPGLLLEFAKMQVPFMADLVTGADPTNPYSFLSYLKQTNRLYQFAILEDNYITRREYVAYCSWVASQLSSLRFGHTVLDIRYLPEQSVYILEVQTGEEISFYHARKLVIGVGSVPALPPGIQTDAPAGITHSSQYLEYKPRISESASVTIIGSGQSAAEIFYDQLCNLGKDKQLNWYTRSDRFHPMETARLTLEMTSPDYVRYFHSLSQEEKNRLLYGQQYLYKGINADLIAAIYQRLYHLDTPRMPVLQTGCSLDRIESLLPMHRLWFTHQPTQSSFSVESHFTILATGYQPPRPIFLENIYDRIRYVDGLYKVNLNYSIDAAGNELFVQNAELHTHGFNTPDLGMGPYRNAIIINTLVGYQHYSVEQGVTFQSFRPKDS